MKVVYKKDVRAEIDHYIINAKRYNRAIDCIELDEYEWNEMREFAKTVCRYTSRGYRLDENAMIYNEIELKRKSK